MCHGCCVSKFRLLPLIINEGKEFDTEEMKRFVGYLKHVGFGISGRHQDGIIAMEEEQFEENKTREKQRNTPSMSKGRVGRLVLPSDGKILRGEILFKEEVLDAGYRGREAHFHMTGKQG